MVAKQALNRIKVWFNHEAPAPVRDTYFDARDAYKYVRYGRFFALKQFTHGMLSPDVYREFYQRVKALPDYDILEIGGAHGAGSISMAWGLIDSGKSSKVITVEKCEGGSRSDFGGRSENLDTIVANLKAFGVDHKVDLFPHFLTEKNANKVVKKIDTKHLAALVMDADGRLDRDFKFFWDRLMPGGLIIVDDYDNVPEFTKVNARSPDGGTKKVMTYRLLNQLEDWGLFEREILIGDTLFGKKPLNSDFSKFNPKVMEKLIVELERERDAFLQKG